LAATVTNDARNAAHGERPDGSRSGIPVPNSPSSSSRRALRRVQQAVRPQQFGQPSARGQGPAEHADLVARHGGQPRAPPVAHRPVQEQRRRRPGQRGQHQAGQRELREHRRDMPQDLVHSPITLPAASDRNA
jgi:hypothetical protein